MPSRSDIDVIAVTRGPITGEQGVAVAVELSEENLPCPAIGLEMSIVTLGATLHPTEAPHYQLHMGTAEGNVVGDDGTGDTDLPMHFAVCRERGRPIEGPLQPEEAFARAKDPESVQAALDRQRGGFAELDPELARGFAERIRRMLLDEVERV